MAVIRSVIRGVGAHLPEKVVTNADLAKIVDTTDEWIVERSGIRERRIAAPHELTSTLGIAASHQALVRAGIDPVDIDLVICATATPDRTFPSTAVKIQAALGVSKGAAFDVQAVCSGFVYALTIADNFIKTGQSKRALVVGAETFSRILDWSDRSTCVLFGDGAGASCSRLSRSTARARIAASSPRAFAPTAASRISSTSTADPARRKRSAICA